MSTRRNDVSCAPASGRRWPGSPHGRPAVPFRVAGGRSTSCIAFAAARPHVSTRGREVPARRPTRSDCPDEAVAPGPCVHRGIPGEKVRASRSTPAGRDSGGRTARMSPARVDVKAVTRPLCRECAAGLPSVSQGEGKMGESRRGQVGRNGAAGDGGGRRRRRPGGDNAAQGSGRTVSCAPERSARDGEWASRQRPRPEVQPLRSLRAWRVTDDAHHGYRTDLRGRCRRRTSPAISRGGPVSVLPRAAAERDDHGGGPGPPVASTPATGKGRRRPCHAG